MGNFFKDNPNPIARRNDCQQEREISLQTVNSQTQKKTKTELTLEECALEIMKSAVVRQGNLSASATAAWSVLAAKDMLDMCRDIREDPSAFERIEKGYNYFYGNEDEDDDDDDE